MRQKYFYLVIIVIIENLIFEMYEEEDFSGIIEFVDVIKFQFIGLFEVVCVICKKFKYGNVYCQLCVFVIFDFFIFNVG